MDASTVLTALQEWERWRARRARLEERLAEIRRRRAALEAEREGVRREMARLAEVLYTPGEGTPDSRVLSPFEFGR